MEEAFEQVEMMPEREFCKASHYNIIDYAHMKHVFDFGTKSRKKELLRPYPCFSLITRTMT